MTGGAQDSGVEHETDAQFLKDLAGRLFRHATPLIGFDQGDTDRLFRIARDFDARATRAEGGV